MRAQGTRQRMPPVGMTLVGLVVLVASVLGVAAPAHADGGSVVA